MKLTREGAARLGCHEARGFPVSDFEFKPEDFDGCCQNGKDHVVLTIEEAKRIVDSLHRAIKAHVEVSRLTNGWTEVSIEVNDIYMLQERIKQAEKDNGTNQ